MCMYMQFFDNKYACMNIKASLWHGITRVLEITYFRRFLF